MRNSKKNGTKKKQKTKLGRRDLTVDEVLIQAAIIMVNTVADTKKEGATVKFETESNGEKYHVDIVIKRIVEEKPKMKAV